MKTDKEKLRKDVQKILTNAGRQVKIYPEFKAFCAKKNQTVKDGLYCAMYSYMKKK